MTQGFHFFLGKLKFKWSRTFTVTQVFPYGTIEVNHKEKETFKVKGQHLKLYLNGEIINKMTTILFNSP